VPTADPAADAPGADPQAPPLVISDKKQVNQSPSGEPVWLHIYDVFGALEKVNSFMKPVGSGAFHAGVEVYGKEWSYGYATEGMEGVYWTKPRCNDRHRYRESVNMGGTPLTETEVLMLVLEMKNHWPGFAYDILVRNCCHFSDALCRRLAVGPAPEWLMHLAGAGAALASGVEKAVVTTHAAAGLAAAKACELDEHYQLTERAEKFLSTEVEVDEESVGASAYALWARAVEQLAPVGALAEMVIDEALKPISEDKLERVEARARELWTVPTVAGGSQNLFDRWWRQSWTPQERERRVKVVACQVPTTREWSRSPECHKRQSAYSSLESTPNLTAEEAAAACEALAAKPHSRASGDGGDNGGSSPSGLRGMPGSSVDGTTSSPVVVAQHLEAFREEDEEKELPASPHQVSQSAMPLDSSPEVVPDSPHSAPLSELLSCGPTEAVLVRASPHTPPPDARPEVPESPEVKKTDETTVETSPSSWDVPSEVPLGSPACSRETPEPEPEARAEAMESPRGPERFTPLRPPSDSILSASLLLDASTEGASPVAARDDSRSSDRSFVEL